jgi:dUTP pyrophosphatase
MTKVKIVNKSNHRLPEYATVGAAGMDLKADILEPMQLKARSSIIVPTGIYVALPDGCEMQIRGRSGLAFKYDIVSHLGTLDADYRGEIKVKLFNLSDNDFVINPGERIAQIVVARYEKVEWEEVATLDETERGEGGFGSTGMK